MKRSKTVCLVVMTLIVALIAGAAAQAPSTDVLLVPLPSEGDAATTVSADDVTYLTNNDTYDNQPSFVPESSAVLYVSQDETGQTDIYRYDVASGEAMRVTETQESEFSPRIAPDGEHITAVRIEADGVTQRLWRFDLEGNNAQPNPENVDRIGYYAFVDPDNLALVRVDEETNGLPLSLDLTDLATSETRQLAGDVGVGVQKVPDRAAVSFVQRLEDGSSAIMVFDLESGETSQLVPTLPEVDAHAWMPDGSLIAAQENVVYRWQEGQGWEPFLDFGETDVSGINRLAVSPDGSLLAFVISK